MWVIFLLLPLPLSVHAEDLGELSANPFNPESTSNPFGAGSPFKPDGLNNPFSNQSATNPYATDAQGSTISRVSIGASSARTRMILIRPVTPTAATAIRSRRTRSTIPSALGIPTTPAVPRIPTAAASELRGADLAAEPLQVISWLLDTSVLHRSNGFVGVVMPGSDRPASTCEAHRSRQ